MSSTGSEKEKSAVPSENLGVNGDRLKEFIVLELEKFDGAVPSAQPFGPLTRGLGLESPKGKAVAEPRASVARPGNLSPETVKPPKKESGITEDLVPPKAMPTSVEKRAQLQTTVFSEPKVEHSVAQDFLTAPLPPPLPRASVLHRLFAVLIDEFFVLTLWVLSLYLTLRLLTGDGGMDTRALHNSVFVRFAALEFATLWISYLAIGIGVLDMTFGMWVWGLRVKYINQDQGGVWLGRLLRMVFSFLFYAPVFPLVLLMFRRRGRNLLDLFSQTLIYRTGV